jgi:hypothetical protein
MSKTQPSMELNFFPNPQSVLNNEPSKETDDRIIEERPNEEASEPVSPGSEEDSLDLSSDSISTAKSLCGLSFGCVLGRRKTKVICFQK